MKKIIIIAAIVISSVVANLSAQTIVRNGNNFAVQVDATAKSSGAIETEFTFTCKDGKTYNIWLSKSGRAYILKVSKSGNTYKSYLGEDISRQVCKELKREYFEKSNNTKSN